MTISKKLISLPVPENITLKDYLFNNDKCLLQVGLLIDLAKPEDPNKVIDTIVVGNCTVYHQPTGSDAEIGWDYEDRRMKYLVVSAQLIQ